jgi:hypothetical protein
MVTHIYPKKLRITQLPLELFSPGVKLIQGAFPNFSPFPPNTNPYGYSVGLQGGK